MKTTSLWIHGHSLEVKYPERLLSIQRTNAYALIEGQPGTTNWFQFAIPSPVIMDNKQLKIAAVFIRFKTQSENVYIKAVNLYDGETLIEKFDFHHTQQDFDTIRIDPALVALNWGLGVSVNVAFNEQADPATIAFSAAGCNFISLPEPKMGKKSKVKARKKTSVKKPKLQRRR
ncbi:hypothetical protein SYNTR_1643 [Candidatus Syntrophocurvum alkaliphilum]|uniref:Uncharacterized protein n=1 Tax=Candidatus Syntrophocurvum alkaliphilum TaxID=2293317 RepID=A0A6I6DGL8_9FIRM|nr:DUF6623 family protein [Candidatus Syntrophocurvum alkaliphilum]QGU00237.1 hypothetical protein SYNTR_1643 [Candidatus Syntrophocurvum alkaliphilum]